MTKNSHVGDLDVGTKLQLRPEERPVRWTKPRLPRADYIGQRMHHITLTTTQRAPLFAVESEDRPFELLLLECTQKTEFELLAYCFMPDHLHVLLRGPSAKSDLPSFVQRFKQVSGFRFKQTGNTLWQQSFFDRVLRRDEDPGAVVRYIFDNPASAGLPSKSAAYYLRGGTHFELPMGAAQASPTDGAEASPLHRKSLDIGGDEP